MLKRLRLQEGWSSFFILALMVLSAFWSIEAGGLAEGLGIISWSVLLGLLLGLALAKSRIPALIAHMISLGIGVVWGAFLVSRLLPPGLAQSDQLVELQRRLGIWLEGISAGGISTDDLVFVLGITALGWLVSYTSTWFIFRTHWVWGAILPTGALVLLNVYYAPPRLVIYFIFYLICALLLIITSHTYLKREEWQRERVRHSDTIGLVFLRDGAILSILLVLIAWLAPISAASPTFQELGEQFAEPWRKVQREWNRLFSSLSYDEPGRTHSFSQMMSLSGAVSLSSMTMMDVTVDEPHYWRAVVMDHYTGAGWIDKTSTSVRLKRDESLPFQSVLSLPFQSVPYLLRHEITQTIEMAYTGETVLFAASQPVAASMEAQMHVTMLPTDTQPPASSGEAASSGAPGEALPLGEISILYAPSALREGKTYSTVSSVSHASAQTLRRIDANYPNWLTQRYLQLPERLPQRVRTLANEITAPYTNPYDKATAIEAYLRRIPYDLSINAPPAGRDAVDWFLFDNQRGYCDYYASAMIVLCRAAGIPARLAQGYARGEYEISVRGYRVRESDAHSWPEIYFPYCGWIEFEPTTAQPLISRVSPDDEAVEPLLLSLLASITHEDEDKFGPDEGEVDREDIEDIVLGPPQPKWREQLVLFYAVGIVLLAALLAIGIILWFRRLRSLKPVESIYARMTDWLSLVGVRPKAYQTPLEFAQVASAKVPPGKGRFADIATMYVKEGFGRQRLSEEEEQNIAEVWKGTWWLILRQVAVLRREKARRRSTRARLSHNELRPF